MKFQDNYDEINWMRHPFKRQIPHISFNDLRLNFEAWGDMLIACGCSGWRLDRHSDAISALFTICERKFQASILGNWFVLREHGREIFRTQLMQNVIEKLQSIEAEYYRKAYEPR